MAEVGFKMPTLWQKTCHLLQEQNGHIQGREVGVFHYLVLVWFISSPCPPHPGLRVGLLLRDDGEALVVEGGETGGAGAVGRARERAPRAHERLLLGAVGGGQEPGTDS